MVLKIDTTMPEEVVVELIDKKTGKEITIRKKQVKGSQVLLPIIHEILKKSKKNLSDLNAIEVDAGPGSFTGTRVGVAVANALGFALDLPVNGKKGKIILPKYAKSKFD